MSLREPILLTDDQMRRFITDGFLLLKTDFPDSFHESLLAQLMQVYETEGNPGNNLLPRIRELQKVFENPIITGALTSVLGPNYMMHAHRHGHFNATPKAGGWHKDSYWGYRRQRNHHPWWAMIMYFPQDTPPELGPTGILPGTQNYESRVFDSEEPAGEALASGQAGTFALIHYDIWHRSTPNLTGQPRYMLKFEFMRTEAPTAPSWDFQESEWIDPPGTDDLPAKHELLWKETWSWLQGRVGSAAGTLPEDPEAIDRLKTALNSEYEPEALNAAYELASRGASGVQVLSTALLAGGAASRAASYGLTAAGAEAVPQLMTALSTPREDVVRHAVFALGELRGLAAEALPALIKLLDHPEASVRQAVVEALGISGVHAPGTIVSGLASALADEDTQVRFTAGLSLARIGPAAASAVSALEAALDDENRYVRAHSLEALRYIGTEQARELLIHELLRTRWCPITTKDNTFYP